MRVRIGDDCLLHQPVEQQASPSGVAAVEPEGELVEVVGQLVLGDREVQGPGQPSLEQRGGQVDSREDLGGVGGVVSVTYSWV